MDGTGIPAHALRTVSTDSNLLGSKSVYFPKTSTGIVSQKCLILSTAAVRLAKPVFEGHEYFVLITKSTHYL